MINKKVWWKEVSFLGEVPVIGFRRDKWTGGYIKKDIHIDPRKISETKTTKKVQLTGSKLVKIDGMNDLKKISTKTITLTDKTTKVEWGRIISAYYQNLRKRV